MRAKTALSLLPTIAVARGANNIAKYESSGAGLNFNNYHEVYQNYMFSTCLLMFLASFFTFMLLGFYLENVLPGVNGFTRPFYFFLQPSYWFANKRFKKAVMRAHTDYNESDQD